jgi:hypothetical protein
VATFFAAAERKDPAAYTELVLRTQVPDQLSVEQRALLRRAGDIFQRRSRSPQWSTETQRPLLGQDTLSRMLMPEKGG